jgi:hypothetical protein
MARRQASPLLGACELDIWQHCHRDTEKPRKTGLFSLFSRA